MAGSSANGASSTPQAGTRQLIGLADKQQQQASTALLTDMKGMHASKLRHFERETLASCLGYICPTCMQQRTPSSI